MPNTRSYTKRSYTKLHAAAYHFSHISRRVDNIAKALAIDEKTVRRYSDDPEWDHALDVFGYTGERKFARENQHATQHETQA